ncbi:MAG: ABC transporter substrate-binding protein [Silvibacterium sp.]
MKIISLQPSVSVILDRVGCLDMLAACTKYCLDAVPALRDRDSLEDFGAIAIESGSTSSGSGHAKQLPRRPIAIVHDSWSTRSEDLLPVQADLVIASIPYRNESLAAILKSGHPVLALAPHTLTDVFADIRHIAHIINAGPKGDALVAEMQAAIKAIHTQAKGIASRPLVYCEEWGKPLIHSQAWVADLIEIAGGTFLGTPGATTTAEAIADANPDIIIAAWCGAGNRVPLEKIIVQRGWQHLTAVRQGRVYCIADELLNTPAPTLTQGLEALASAIHPDVFGAPHAPSVRRMDQIHVSNV